MLEGNPVSSDILARWTIIEQRWPGLADQLIVTPGLVEALGKTLSADKIEKLPQSIQPLANDKGLHAALLNKRKQLALKADHVRTIAGI